MSARAGFAPDWPAPPSVRAWVTERGGSRALRRAESRDARGRRRRRRRGEPRPPTRASSRLPAEPSWLEQVHGARVLDLDREQIAPADGAVTARAGVVCAVLTADCLPVVLCDRAGRRVGVAHAGWRGLLAGVLPAAVAAFRQDPAEILAWLGPAIGPAAYEVGADVRDPFVARSPRAERWFARNARGRWQADLYGLARDSLAAAGVRSVHGGGLLHVHRGRAVFLAPARGSVRPHGDAGMARPGSVRT